MDGLVIADLISLTQQRAITHALLITGDADITPGIIAAQSMGLRVHLLSLGSSAATSPYLAAEVDLKRCWGKEEMARFAQVAHNMTRKEATAPSNQFSITAEMLDSLARAAKEQMVSTFLVSELSQLLVPGATTLPKEIDTLLLSTARKALGRSLQTTEKLALRAAFKRLC